MVTGMTAPLKAHCVNRHQKSSENAMSSAEHRLKITLYEEFGCHLHSEYIEQPLVEVIVEPGEKLYTSIEKALFYSNSFLRGDLKLSELNLPNGENLDSQSSDYVLTTIFLARKKPMTNCYRCKVDSENRFSMYHSSNNSTTLSLDPVLNNIDYDKPADHYSEEDADVHSLPQAPLPPNSPNRLHFSNGSASPPDSPPGPLHCYHPPLPERNISRHSSQSSIASRSSASTSRRSPSVRSLELHVIIHSCTENVATIWSNLDQYEPRSGHFALIDVPPQQSDNGRNAYCILFQDGTHRHAFIFHTSRNHYCLSKKEKQFYKIESLLEYYKYHDVPHTNGIRLLHNI